MGLLPASWEAMVTGREVSQSCFWLAHWGVRGGGGLGDRVGGELGELLLPAGPLAAGPVGTLRVQEEIKSLCPEKGHG